MKELRDRLLRSKGHPSLDKVEDINVLCNVIKDFLRSLREPILTFALHETFIKAACKLTRHVEIHLLRFLPGVEWLLFGIHCSHTVTDFDIECGMIDIIYIIHSHK